MFGVEPESILALSGLALYAAIFFLPFLQEDVAVVAAATASLMDRAPDAHLFGVILAGLIASDVWKYWIGWFGRRNKLAHKIVEWPGVSVAGDLVRMELLKTLYVARFVPGTRVPTYVACGFFKVEYSRFVALVALTALTYVVISFALFHTVGVVLGEQAALWLPAIAIALLVVYVAYRWLTHRHNKHGPMTPLTEARDHPLPGMPGFEGTPLEEERKS
jgi:membrane protein DedA with SNARE-associated domain